jgi:beta-lactam-binding protein with PASTA domain
MEGSTEPSTHAGGSSPATGDGERAGGDRQEERVVVPNLVGERFMVAVRKVRAAGLEQQAPGFTGTLDNPDNEGGCEQILRQAPPAGTKVEKGGTVWIVYGACRSSITQGRLGEDAGRPH